MEYLLGALALFVSLVAAYLGSAAMRRVEGQTQEFVRNHIQGLRQSLETHERGLDGLKAGLQQATQEIKEIKGVAIDAARKEAAFEQAVEALQVQVKQLERRLPSSARG